MPKFDVISRPLLARDLAIFVLLFAFPSTSLFHGHLGVAGVAGYLVFVAVAWALVRRFLPRFDGLAERGFRVFCGLLVAGLVVVFLIGYPIENSRGPIHSSDRDNGLNIAVERLCEGRSPYYPERDDAGPLSLLPGAVFLGAPFALMGNSAYQNIFWVLAFLLACAAWVSGRRVALALVFGMMALSPATQYELISGGDMLSNGLYVPVAMLACLETQRRAPTRYGLLVAASVVLGLCLASRPNFMLLLPLYAAAAWRTGGFRSAFTSAAIAGTMAVGLCLAFYLPDPAGFTPLPTGNKLAAIDRVYPYASKCLIVGTILLAVAAPFKLLRSERSSVTLGLCRSSAVVILFPMLGAVALYSWIGGGLELDFIRDRYGLMYLPFALIGFGVPLLRSASIAAPSCAPSGPDSHPDRGRA